MKLVIAEKPSVAMALASGLAGSISICSIITICLCATI